MIRTIPFSLRLGSRSAALAVAALAAIAPASAQAQTLAAPFDADYTLASMGTPAGVPSPLGGLTVKAGDPDTLIIGGSANTVDGALYEIGLVRDGDGHITGFSGSASLLADAPSIDGGLDYGPGGEFFFTQYPTNGLGQIEPGSAAPDKLIDLTPLGVAASVGTLRFVPGGFPGAGRLKIASYNHSLWYDADVADDGSGTWDVVDVSQQAAFGGGGPEGIAYVPLGSTGFPNPSVLVSMFASGKVLTFDVDADGDPLVATQRDFVTGLNGAEGAAIDPVTGDFLFSTFGGSEVIVVRGFDPPVPPCFGVEPGTLTQVDAANGPAYVSDGVTYDGTNAAGEDVFTGTPGDDVIIGTEGKDNAFGGKGDDRICLRAGDDRGRGGKHSDQITGGDDNDRVWGDNGPDDLTGAGGDDKVDGEAGADTVDGATGDDTLLGGAANDVLTGGAGDDDMDGDNGSSYYPAGTADECDGGADTDTAIRCEVVTDVP